MSKKSIKIQIQNIGNNAIPPIKDAGWLSATVDNIKISLDAYKNGSGYSGEPREDSLLEIADRNEVFELSPELLMKIIRFFVAYSSDRDQIIRFKNKYHYISPDAVKPAKKG